MNPEVLREYCLSMPGTTEGMKWEHHICFMVAEKIFCMASVSDEGVCFKVTGEEFQELTEREGIIQTPYMARNKWVTVLQYHKMSETEWLQYIAQSYRLVMSKLPKRVQNQIIEGIY